MPRTFCVIALMLVTVSAATGCVQRSTSTANPIGPSETGVVNTPTAAQPTLVGTWRSVVIRAASLTPITRSLSSGPASMVLDPTSCGSFQWVVASQTSNSISGQFSAVCAGTPVSGTGGGQLTGPTTVALTIEGSGTLPGLGPCAFSISANGPLENDTLHLQYAGTSCAGPFSGNETLRRDDIYPDPVTPEPPPPPPPPPPSSSSEPPPPPPSQGGGNSGPSDELDLHTVSVVLGADLTNWSVTSTMTEAYRSGTDLCTYHTKAGAWPRMPWFGDPGTLVEGNQWMFARINGKWYGGAGEWLRPGQQCKNVDGHIGEGAFGGTIMEHWTPSPGELIGVAVSTPARAGQWGLAERSNVVLIHW